MRANPKALALVTNKLDLVVVDEFQDVSRVQVELLIQLVGTRAHLNAVGDDSQCIYAWRGARPGDHGGGVRPALPRGDPLHPVADLPLRPPGVAGRGPVDRPTTATAWTPCASRRRPRRTPASRCSAPPRPGTSRRWWRPSTDWRRAGRSLREVAVLARLWAQTLSLELALLERDIPYVKAKDDLFSGPRDRRAAGLPAPGRRHPLRRAARPRDRPAHARDADPVAAGGQARGAWRMRSSARPRGPATCSCDRPQGQEALSETRDRRACAPVRHEVLGWADLPAADALRFYAARTDLVRAFASSATSEAAAEKELAYQTLLDWAVRTRTTCASSSPAWTRCGSRGNATRPAATRCC